MKRISLLLALLQYISPGYGAATSEWSSGSLSDGVLSCLLEPSQEISISSQVAGVVKQMKVERGDQIKKGQTLFSLESGVELAALDIAKAKAAFAARKVQRNKKLLEKELLSDYERDELMTDMKLGSLVVKEAEARLRQRTLASPVDGVVVERLASVGEYVSTEPVLELATLNPLHAELILKADYYGQIQPGTEVLLRIEQRIEQNDETFYPGRVAIVDKLIHAASGTFGIQVQVPNPDFVIPAGLKCQVELEP